MRVREWTVSYGLRRSTAGSVAGSVAGSARASTMSMAAAPAAAGAPPPAAPAPGAPLGARRELERASTANPCAAAEEAGEEDPDDPRAWRSPMVAGPAEDLSDG